MKRPLFYLVLGIAVIVIGTLTMRTFNIGGDSPGRSSGTSTPVNKVEIGGPFTLVDHNGKVVTDADYKNRYMLVFFGYTFCPDVCPTALAGVSDMLDILGDDADKIAPLFISVDIKRDTVDILKEYVGNFHPKIIGLTGSQEQITSVAKAYRAYFSIENDGDSNGENYSVSHSAYLYLMGPDGKFLTAFGHQTDPAEMAKKFRENL